jgi:hypothetical protein
MADIFLAFGNIFLGIVIIMVAAKAWTWIENKFLYKLTPLIRYSILLFITVLGELLVVYLIYKIFPVSLNDSLFITGFILFVFIWAIPYYSGFFMNRESTILTRYGAEKQKLKLFTPKLSPFFLGSLSVSIIFLLISIGRYYL